MLIYPLCVTPPLAEGMHAQLIKFSAFECPVEWIRLGMACGMRHN